MSALGGHSCFPFLWAHIFGTCRSRSFVIPNTEAVCGSAYVHGHDMYNICVLFDPIRLGYQPVRRDGNADFRADIFGQPTFRTRSSYGQFPLLIFKHDVLHAVHMCLLRSEQSRSCRVIYGLDRVYKTTSARCLIVIQHHTLQFRNPAIL